MSLLLSSCWPKNAWVLHNLIGHPLMQILSWLGFKDLAIQVHDATVPTPMSPAPDSASPQTLPEAALSHSCGRLLPPDER